MREIAALIFLMVVIPSTIVHAENKLYSPYNYNNPLNPLSPYRGSSTNGNSKETTYVLYGIPIICFVEETFEAYAECRTPSALMLGWVKRDKFLVWFEYTYRYMKLSKFLEAEWKIIEKDRENNKCQ